MNRIYKVIYSKARQCAIVVSELAKSSHKNSRKGASHTGTPALARILAAALVAGAVTWGGVSEVSWAADDTAVTDSNGNTVTNSSNQQDNMADFKLVDSTEGSAPSIVVGRNQNTNGIEESIVIGSLSSAEQSETTDNPNHHYKYTVGRNSIILGNHASNTMGESIVVGNRSQGNGQFQTIMGHRSIIQGYSDQSEKNYIAENYGALSSIYGAFNTIESARPVFEDSSNYAPYFKAVDGFGNSINGTLNKTSSARGTMIMGAANTVTHSQPDIIKANVFGFDDSMDDVWLQDVTSAVQYYNLGVDGVGKNVLNLSYDDAIAAMKAYVANASGAVSVLGNGNAADYAIRSQILGTANTLTGNQNKISANNTINGYGNTGTNITHSAVVGSNNTLSNGEDNVVIGDYHNMNGGKHNVVLGSMKSKEQTSQKEYKSPVWQDDKHNGVKYNVTEQVPVKEHKNDIENAVMVGYNTDVTQNGGVALGSDSVASTEAGKTGYDALGWKHAKSDKDYTAWNATDAAVSVGGADREIEYDVLDKDGKPETNEDGSKKTAKQKVKSTRQITNLAAGTEDTDAVNVAQMKAAADAVKTHFYSVNSQDTKAGNYNNDGATGTDALAAGVWARAEADHSIAIGTNAWTNEGDSRAKGSGDIAIGNYSKTGNYVNQSGSIAIGQNAFAENMAGNQEAIFAFGQTNYGGTELSSVRSPDDASKVPTAIAIGQNSYARTGGLTIGTHNYNGKLGDVTVNSNDSTDVNAKSKNVFTTTLGTNSYNVGAFSTVTGAYSIASGSYKGGRSSSDAGKNFGATITGSLNSVESATATNYSGIANSIVGTANRTFNSNGSLIFGAGNEITNSVTTISAPSDGGVSAQALQKTLMQTVKDSNGGGATLAIGGGNKIDHAVRSQAIGVNNTLTGNLYHKDGLHALPFLDIPDVNEYSAQYNMVDGYNNNVANVNHAYIIGANNNIQGKTFSDATKDGVLSETDREKAQKDDNLIVIGDNHTLANDVSNNIILGTADETLTTSASNIVILGHNANAKVEGGVAIGSGSIADTEAGVFGWDPKTKIASISDGKDWKSSSYSMCRA